MFIFVHSKQATRPSPLIDSEMANMNFSKFQYLFLAWCSNTWKQKNLEWSLFENKHKTFMKMFGYELKIATPTTRIVLLNRIVILNTTISGNKTSEKVEYAILLVINNSPPIGSRIRHFKRQF
jgi:hypothetical protein